MVKVLPDLPEGFDTPEYRALIPEGISSVTTKVGVALDNLLSKCEYSARGNQSTPKLDRHAKDIILQFSEESMGSNEIGQFLLRCKEVITEGNYEDVRFHAELLQERNIGASTYYLCLDVNGIRHNEFAIEVTGNEFMRFISTYYANDGFKVTKPAPGLSFFK